jgi:hypothetical protein
MKQSKLDFTYDGRRVVVFVDYDDEGIQDLMVVAVSPEGHGRLPQGDGEWEESTRLARELEKEESGRFLEALEWELETEEEQSRMESAIDAAEYRMADR